MNKSSHFQLSQQPSSRIRVRIAPNSTSTLTPGNTEPEGFVNVELELPKDHPALNHDVSSHSQACRNPSVQNSADNWNFETIKMDMESDEEKSNDLSDEEEDLDTEKSPVPLEQFIEDSGAETDTDTDTKIDPALLKVLSRPTIKCEWCPRKFKKLASYNKHVAKHHPTSLTCHICSEVFKTMYRFGLHRKSVHHLSKNPESNSPVGKAIHQCTVCGQKLTGRSVLNRHMKRIHLGGQNPYKCGHCPKTFWDEDCFSKHILGCAPDKSLFKCPFCPKSYGIEQSLNDHLGREHSGRDRGKGDFECTICAKKFLTENGLKTHIGLSHSHLTNSNFSCTLCPKTFEKIQRLKEHMKRNHQLVSDIKYNLPITNANLHFNTVITPKPLISHGNGAEVDTESQDEGSGQSSFTYVFPCSAKDCLETFSRASDLVVHEKQHRKSDWICKVCSKLFDKNCLLKRHMVTHTGESKHKCPVCLKVFTKRNGLYTHLDVHIKQMQIQVAVADGTSSQLQPQPLQSKSKSKSNTVDFLNLNSGDLQCPYCPGIFSGVTELRTHLREQRKCSREGFFPSAPLSLISL